MILRVSRGLWSSVAVLILISLFSLPLSIEIGSSDVAVFPPCAEKHEGGMLSLDKFMRISPRLQLKKNSGIEADIFEARRQRRGRGWGAHGEEKAGGTMRLRGGKKPKNDAEKLAMWRNKFPLGMALYDACGGVAPGEGDNWYMSANLTEIAALIERGASVNFQGPGKYTPLHFAAMRGFTEACQMLLAKGANVNASNEWMWTPLHCAATAGHTATVQALADAGADLYALTIHTNLPLDEATGMQHWRTSSLLKRLMGPNWHEFCRQSYHECPNGRYEYDRMETITDDEIALYWQAQIRAKMGDEGLAKAMAMAGEGGKGMSLEIDPELRSVAGWVDDAGKYHAPWEMEVVSEGVMRAGGGEKERERES